jgi:hypothetical protein
MKILFPTLNNKKKVTIRGGQNKDPNRFIVA